MPRQVAGAGLLRCESCLGIWARAGQLAEIVRTENDLRATFPAKTATAFACPDGSEARLEEVRYSKTEEALLLDRCPECAGLYLDRGEVDQVLRINARIRELFGDATFTGPAPRGGVLGLLTRLFS